MRSLCIVGIIGYRAVMKDNWRMVKNILMILLINQGFAVILLHVKIYNP